MKKFAYTIQRIMLIILAVFLLTPVSAIGAVDASKAIEAAETAGYLAYLRGIGFPALEAKDYSYKLTVGSDGYPLPVDYELPVGVAAIKLADFDGDGRNEMLAVLSTLRKSEWGGYDNKFTAKLLKNKNGAITEIASAGLADKFMQHNSDTGYADIFIRRNGGKYEICCETYQFSGTWADGATWSLTACSVYGGMFSYSCEFNESGSYFEDEDDIVLNVEKAGFKISKLFDRVTKSGNAVETLCTVEFFYDGEWEEFFDIVHGGSIGEYAPMIVQIRPISIPAGQNTSQQGQTSSREQKTARPTSSEVLVDGFIVAFEAYNIDDFNYFKLRDIAYIIKDSPKRFGIGWDEAKNAISLTTGAPYIPVGGEMGKGGSTAKTAEPTDSVVLLNGKEIKLTAYNIDGYNYFKLRDVGQAAGFRVDWVESADMIVINSSDVKSMASGPLIAVYTVKPGDTLFSIAQEFYGSVEYFSLIASENGLDLTNLHDRQMIVIPGID